MIAAWGDPETEEEEDQQNEETANLCLMANTDIKEDEENVEVSQHILPPFHNICNTFNFS